MIYNNAVILFRRNAEKELRSGKEAHAGLLWTAYWKGIKYDSKRGNSRSWRAGDSVRTDDFPAAGGVQGRRSDRN